jgi:hypothetical protein
MNATAIKTNKINLKLSHWRLGSWDYLGGIWSMSEFLFVVFQGYLGVSWEYLGTCGRFGRAF